MKLEGRRDTRHPWKDRPQMFDRLQQRIRLFARRWGFLATEPDPDQVQPLAQFIPQPIHCFQREGQFFRRRLERSTRQQPNQQLPEP